MGKIISVSAAALVLLLAAGCGASSNPPAPAAAGAAANGGQGGTTTTTKPAFQPAPVQWKPCDIDVKPFDCATVSVPLDYDHPDGRKIDLALKRRPATDKANRIGTLFFNPGGPGGSGVELLDEISKDLDTNVLARFDVVGWDPRGVGESAPLSCDEGYNDFFDQDLGATHPPQSVNDAAKKWADLCERKNGDLLPYLGTIDVTRDLDVLRAAVGDDKITFAGFSYGSLIGLMYAELFPSHIRALLIDGIVDPTLDPETAVIRQSKSVDEALARFVDWCKGDAACPLKPDPESALDHLRSQAEKDPLTATVNGRGIFLNSTYLNLGLITATYDSTLWPQLAKAVDEGLKGNSVALAQFVKAYLNSAAPSLNMAVGCLDSATPSGDAFEKIVVDVAAVAPDTGAFNANSGRPCLFWPVPPKPIPSEYHGHGTPPIMVWGTTGDNATPYENAVKMAKTLDNARLVTLDANRHTAVGGNECVTKLQGDYLLNLALPPEGTKC